MKLRRLSLFCLAISWALASFAVMANDKLNNWVEAKNISSNFRAVAAQPEIEVFSAPNTIMIKVNQDTEVRIFSILGKLISNQKLSPGIYQFNLDVHGIYIIKTDSSSYKIAV